MTPPFYLRLKCAGALILLGAGGCTQLDPDSTRRQVQDRLEPLLAAVVHKRQAKPDGSTNLQLPDAQYLALTTAPGMQRAYIQLDIDGAAAVQAAALPNPVLEVSSLALDPGTGRERGFTIASSLTALLTLRARRDGLQAARHEGMYTLGKTAQQTLTAVQAAWLKLVAAREHAALAQVNARTEALANDLAQQFADAGNVNARYLARARAANAEAHVVALAREADVVRARQELADLLGLETAGDWFAATSLPAPPGTEPDAPDAHLRFDLALAEAKVAVAATSQRADNMTSAADLHVGWEQERAPGDRARGPIAEMGLPLFSRGTAKRAIASGELALAQLNVQTVKARISNAIHTSTRRIGLARERYGTIAETLLPERIAATEAAQAEANFMLTSPFELIRTKQREFAAHAARVDALLEYWLARAGHAHAAGHPLVLSPDAANQDRANAGLEQPPHNTHRTHPAGPAHESSPSESASDAPLHHPSEHPPAKTHQQPPEAQNHAHH